MAGFFWFLIGAGSATIWGQHKQWHEQHPEVGFWSNWNDRRKGLSCPSQQATPQIQNEAQMEKAPPTPAHTYQDAMMQQQASAPQKSSQSEWQSWGPWGSRQQQHGDSFKQWDERDFQKMRTKAQDAMADMGEATLDTLMATILAAKTKLAEQKERRAPDEKH
ncbi:hypothetical protein CYLTODRAFT_453889 [Cylindrobasidium torrendii FP15055 ss-10]|uniref:Uncharacterized protein n=1 Tax=Cylindrobasidium torrendii FP15055 ss-10 TaxID=1314674 RepID=A0A0D7BCX7_9AGAR|nr:hypothetical protein CYLTODRAFT_453889 [Cylindrobasidium torrendii FP15055 ss-10]